MNVFNNDVWKGDEVMTKSLGALHNKEIIEKSTYLPIHM